MTNEEKTSKEAGGPKAGGKMTFRLSAVMAVSFAVLTLVANALFFGFKDWNGTPEGIYATPYGISAVFDVFIASLFIAGLAPFGFLKFKAFACAGFFAYWGYCLNGAVSFSEMLMWILLGLLCGAMRPRSVAVIGLSAFCLCIISNMKIF